MRVRVRPVRMRARVLGEMGEGWDLITEYVAFIVLVMFKQVL